MSNESFGGRLEPAETIDRQRARAYRAAVRRRDPGQLDSLVRAALDSARPGLIVMDRDFHVRLITRAAIDLLGLLPDDAALAQPVMTLLAGSRSLDASALQTIAAAFALTGDPEPREVLMSLPASGPYGTRVVAIDVRPAGQQGWVASLEDVTQSRQTQDWLLEHASSDPVTGLRNRQHFMLMLQDRLDDDPAGGALVLLVSLVRLGAVAMSLGTHAGDAILRVAAARMSSLLREEDLLARFAGGEFAILVSGQPDAAGAAALAARVAETLSRPYVIEGQSVTIRAHVGAARAPADANTPEALSAAATLALSSASATKSVCFFEPGLHERARKRRHLEHDLSRALGSDQFELWYQPQVDVSRNCISVFEALIRWRTPTRGLVPPLDFIPIAEETGLIVSIGDWVLQRACLEAAAWPEEIAVAINASALQFETGKFGDSVAGALAASGLPGHRLEVEVTESLLLHDEKAVERTLAALREQGVRLVLDDFGTGYASLSQLSRFRFDKIKIDRSFISPPDASADHSAIVRSIAALGVSLGIPTTAEGVETLVQLDRTRADGCTCVQGYYFSKPVPADLIGSLLKRLHHARAA